jgi:uncharacterized protein YukE
MKSINTDNFSKDKITAADQDMALINSYNATLERMKKSMEENVAVLDGLSQTIPAITGRPINEMVQIVQDSSKKMKGLSVKIQNELVQLTELQKQLNVQFENMEAIKGQIPSIVPIQ